MKFFLLNHTYFIHKLKSKILFNEMELNINKTNDSLPKQITYKWRENNNNKLGVVGRENSDRGPREGRDIEEGRKIPEEGGPYEFG